MVIPHHFIDSQTGSFLDSRMHMKFLAKWAFLIAFNGFGWAFAQNTTTLKKQSALSPVATTESSTKAVSALSSRSYQLSASLFSYNYLNSTETLNQIENEYGVRFFYDQNVKNQAQQKVDLRFGGYPKNSFSYFAAPEIFWGNRGQDHQGWQWSLGRRVQQGSEIDQRFNLGMVNPVLTQDYIHFDRQGLTAVELGYQGRYWQSGVSFLGLYVPNQGPMVEESKGQIITANRWAKKPPMQFAFNNQNKPIVYNIKDYRFQDIVFNSGARADISLGRVQETPVLNLSYSRQPINEVVLARETYANLDIIGQVQLVPVVVYTRNVTADVSYKNKATTVFASFIQDAPENKSAPEYHSIQNLEGITGYAVGFEYQIESRFFDKLTSEVSAAEFVGGKIVDLNSDGTENVFTFSKQRLQFTRPVQFKIKSDTTVLGDRRLSSAVSWLYDQTQKGTVFSGQMALQATRAFTVHVGADVLGKDEESLKDELFIDQYKSNDRFYGGMVYVF